MALPIDVVFVQQIVDHPQRAEYDLSSMRWLGYGGSPIDLPILDRARKALPGASFTQAYGMTELSPVATVLLPTDHERTVLTLDRLSSAGRAAPHAVICIFDPQTENFLGARWERSWCAGHVMLGYWGKPEETQTALRGGWMHTGDAGRMDDHGYVYIFDRIKDMIITGGENVYSTEVENA